MKSFTEQKKLVHGTFSQWSILLKIIIFTLFFVHRAISLIVLRWCFFFAIFLHCRQYWSSAGLNRQLFFFFDNAGTWWGRVVRYHELIDPVKYEIYLHKNPLEKMDWQNSQKLTFPTFYNTIVLALFPLYSLDCLSLVNMEKPLW